MQKLHLKLIKYFASKKIRKRKHVHYGKGRESRSRIFRRRIKINLQEICTSCKMSKCKGRGKNRNLKQTSVRFHTKEVLSERGTKAHKSHWPKSNQIAIIILSLSLVVRSNRKEWKWMRTTLLHCISLQFLGRASERWKEKFPFHSISQIIYFDRTDRSTPASERELKKAIRIWPHFSRTLHSIFTSIWDVPFPKRIHASKKSLGVEWS